MKKSTLHNTSILLISISAAAYLKSLLAYFTISQQPAFVLMIITASCIVLGAAAVLYMFLEQKIKKDPERFLWYLSFLLIPLITLSFLLQNILPFNSETISDSKIQYLWLFIRCILHSIPLFTAALYFTVSLKYYKSAYSFCFLSAFGIACGILISFGFTFFLRPGYMVLPAVVIAFLASLAAMFNPRKRYPGMVISLKELLICSAVLIAVMLPSLLVTDSITIQKLDKSRLWADSDLMPPQAESIDRKEPAISLAYEFFETADILIFGSSWKNYLEKISRNSRFRTSLAESNIRKGLKLQQKRLNFTREADSLWTGMSDLKIGPAYSSIHLFDKKFNIIDLPCYNISGSTLSAGQAVSEDYTFTIETVASYLRTLARGGILSISIRDEELPPRAVPRLLFTLAETLEISGKNYISQCIYMYSQPGNIITFLVKPDSFSFRDYQILHQLSGERVYTPLYPSMYTKKTPDFTTVNSLFYDYFMKEQTGKKGENPQGKRFLLYSRMADLALSESAEKVYENYLFDIRPVKNNNPYFDSFITPVRLRQLSVSSGMFPEEWGYILLVTVLVLAASISVLLILLPLFADKNLDYMAGKKSCIIYYIILGIAQAGVFSALLSAFTFFTSFRIITRPVLQTIFFALYGAGCMYAGKWHNISSRKNLYTSIIITFILILFVFILMPLLQVSLPAPLFVRIIITVILASPAPFFMGIFLPAGLDVLSADKPDYLPWSLSAFLFAVVSGSIIARLLLIHSGISMVLALSGVLFIAAGLLFKKNMIGISLNQQ